MAPPHFRADGSKTPQEVAAETGKRYVITSAGDPVRGEGGKYGDGAYVAFDDRKRAERFAGSLYGIFDSAE